MLQVPTVREAEVLLAWAQTQNPGAWVAHSRTVGRAARTIAAACGMDAERCHAMGLLHDVGRYEGPSALRHVIAGYDLMMAKGYPGAALGCLTHSFPIQRLAAFSGANDCSAEETGRIEALLAAVQYNDELRLIQLCDALCLPDRVTLMERRLMDVALRHGVDEHSTQKWRAFFDLKERFDRKCGQSVYALFAQEIMADIGLA